ncbi:hypothetical protein [Paraflavitalea sp. CAU 1676]|uniref:hypothetical protein n=1 Tax=Paraflavitalea sp. CAU 1676 TaxID=3032598 RepID=UPI0023DA1211|nr:hypothetical protein [Paraflavitalea sp. CAU 1676]MDF2193433.1 hypothetical protein [Paraflavitalea sp. CAU 1676]
MNKYYLLKKTPDRDNKKAANSSLLDYDQLELLQGRVEIKDKIFRVKKGFDNFDFLETDWPGLKLCSERVVEFLEKQCVRMLIYQCDTSL